MRIVPASKAFILSRHGRPSIRQELEARARRIAQNERRCSFLVNRKVLPAAVKRNKWRRIAREIIRRNFDNLPQGYEFLIKLRQAPSMPLTYRAWEQPVLTVLKDAIKKITDF
jgi:ribonuclease P protein component